MKKINISLFHAGFQKELETQMLEATRQTARYMRGKRRANRVETTTSPWWKLYTPIDKPVSGTPIFLCEIQNKNNYSFPGPGYGFSG